MKMKARWLWSIIIGILKEIADESPYERHLAAHDRTHSPAEWRRFSDQRLKGKYQRAQCC
jgi:hypothetical protein